MHAVLALVHGVQGGKAAGAAGKGKGPQKGGLAKGHFVRRRTVGPLHTVRVTHASDGCELELNVQAIVKQDVGVGCSLYLVMHASQPR